VKHFQLKIRRLSETAILPRYAHPDDAGLDLFAAREVTIEPGASQVVPTGVAIELPPGTEAQVRPRSGLAAKHLVTVLNAPGTIDQGFRGELGVILINHGRSAYRVQHGDRIGQLVVQERLAVEVIEVEALSDSPRGSGGFGSTGQ
jgi:dUTP pyrophosphatase